MMEVLIVVVIFLLGHCIYWGFFLGSQIPKILLRKRMRSIIDISGKSRHEITSVLGDPSNIANEGREQSTYHWIVRGYHVAITFEGDSCIRATQIEDEYV